MSERRYYKEVRFRQMRALVETARAGSFAEAARQLRMATTSVWRQVRALEEEYEVSLVLAQGQNVRLTADGELLVSLAGPLVEGFDSIRKVFTDMHGKMERRLRLAAPAGTLNGPVSEIISEYRRAHPAVTLSLIDLPSRDAWEALEQDKADFAIVGHPKSVQFTARFDVTPLVKLPFQVVCPASHRIAAMKKPTLVDLLREPLILAGENASSRMQFEHVITKSGLSDQVKVSVTASNVSLILNAVLQGMGIAILTRTPHEVTRLPAPAARKLVFRDITHALGHDEVVLLQPRGRFELPHIRYFREMVVKGLREEEP